MLWIIIGILVSYLVGSIPTAYIFGRLFKGVDIRKVGSGNVGATNAMRVLGRGTGITVLLLDILKGLLTVIFLGNFLIFRTQVIPEENLRLILGLVCICGHNWTIFLRFKGGKGVATTLGVLLGLTFNIPGLRIVLGLLILSWLVVFLSTRIISVASIISALVFPVFLFIFRRSFVNFSTFMLLGTVFSIFIILRHKSNLTRIMQGKEPKLSFKKLK